MSSFPFFPLDGPLEFLSDLSVDLGCQNDGLINLPGGRLVRSTRETQKKIGCTLFSKGLSKRGRGVSARGLA
jgi:hypothetical protein